MEAGSRMNEERRVRHSSFCCKVCRRNGAATELMKVQKRILFSSWENYKHIFIDGLIQPEKEN